jgi:hypothetical protein
MDEEKFLKKTKGSKASVNNSDHIEIEQEVEAQKEIAIPACLNRPPVYSFES